MQISTTQLIKQDIKDLALIESLSQKIQNDLGLEITDSLIKMTYTDKTDGQQITVFFDKDSAAYFQYVFPNKDDREDINRFKIQIKSLDIYHELTIYFYESIVFMYVIKNGECVVQQYPELKNHKDTTPPPPVIRAGFPVSSSEGALLHAQCNAGICYKIDS